MGGEQEENGRRGEGAGIWALKPGVVLQSGEGGTGVQSS